MRELRKVFLLVIVRIQKHTGFLFLIQGKIVMNKDVYFMEDKCWQWDEKTSMLQNDAGKKSIIVDISGSGTSNLSNNGTLTTSGSESDGTLDTQTRQESASSVDESRIQNVRALRDVYESCTFALHVSNPVTFDEAEKVEVWRKAMAEELILLKRMVLGNYVTCQQKRNDRSKVDL